MNSNIINSLVTCQLQGQLGNQLFTLSATLAYAWEYNVRPIFPVLYTDRYQIPYNREHIFFRLDAKNGPRPFINIHEEVNFFTYTKIPFKEDLYIEGYYQSWRYFHLYREAILSIFAPSDATENYLNTKYKAILDHPKTVSVHIRTSSPKVHSTIPFIGLEYIENSMNRFPSDSLFIIFSDRINWCKNKLSSWGKKIVFIEGNDPIQDLFLMSRCKDHIIANSTFSWWGAYLDPNPNKKVICPRFWGGYPRMETFDDIYFSEWEKMAVNLAPYPEDMKSYDKRSLSIDNND